MTGMHPDLRQDRPLWKPSPESMAKTNLTRYLDWLAEKRDLKFPDYAALWTWSTNEPGEFWSSIADFFNVRFHQPAACALSFHRKCPARDGSTARRSTTPNTPCARSDDGEAAILFEAEAAGGHSRQEEISRSELRRQVALVAAQLRAMGVKRGDRVAGYLSNTPETVLPFWPPPALGRSGPTARWK